MRFTPEKPPFPYWVGPYSPARGTSSGFRIKDRHLGVWTTSGEGQTFCPVQETDGVTQLVQTVRSGWQGGRVLFLPGGYIVKPLQNEDEQGMRVFLGRFEGGLKIVNGNHIVDLSKTSVFNPGQAWLGPNTIGLECNIKSDESLSTHWSQPTEYGYKKCYEKISGSCRELFSGFKEARPFDEGGRVRITVGGHVITNKKIGDDWCSFYVGRVNPSQFANWDRWIRRR